MASVPISELPPLEEGAVAASDELVIVDVSASATKKVTTSAMVGDALKLLPPSSVPESIIAPKDKYQTVGTYELQDKSVTADKLADVSTGKFLSSLTGKGSDGDYIGQVGAFANGSYMWNGVRWLSTSAQINAVGSFNDYLQTSISSFEDNLVIETSFVKNTNNAGKILGYDAQGNVQATNIDSSVLPFASAATWGVVRVPDAQGLKVQGGVLSVDNAITAQDGLGLRALSWNAQGMITGSRGYLDGDIPYATTTNSGVIKLGNGLRSDATGTVSVEIADLDVTLPIATSESLGAVKPVAGLNVMTDGTLNVAPNPNDPQLNIGTKIQYDSNGLIVANLPLDTGDIPLLDFSQIVSGTLTGAFLEDGSVPRRALSDFCVSYIQEAEPPVEQTSSIGTFWYKESTKILRIYTGTRWAQVGASGSGSGGGAPATLEFSGFIDASTGLITQVTSIGQNAGGMVVGQPLPAPTDELTGFYVIVTVGGDQIAETPDDTYTQNDWCICLGETEGWSYFAQGAGSPGAVNLTDLLDVQIDVPGEGHMLTFNPTAGKWQNSRYVSGQANNTIIQHRYSTEDQADITINDLQFGEFFVNVAESSPKIWLKVTDQEGNESMEQWTSDAYLTRVESIEFQEPIYNIDESGDLNNPVIAIREATTDVAGSMSAADKAKLDSINVDAANGIATLTGATPVVITDKDPENNPGLNLEVSVPLAAVDTSGLMSASDKTKLDTLSNATQIQSDWAIEDGASTAYIKNKPVEATSAVSGLMSAADKGKLDTIASGATVGISEAPADGKQYARRNNAWQEVVASGSSNAITISATPPGGAKPGDFWLDNATGELHVYYTDINSSQWLNTSTAGGGNYMEGIVKPPQMGGNPPVDPRPGDFWFDSTNATLYIYYSDGDSDQWVSVAGPGGGSGGRPHWFQTDPPSDPLEGDLWIRSSTLKQYVYTGSAWASVICC